MVYVRVEKVRWNPIDWMSPLRFADIFTNFQEPTNKSDRKIEMHWSKMHA